MVGRHVEQKCIFGSFLYLIKSNSRDVGSCINELNSDYSNFAHFFFIRFSLFSILPLLSFQFYLVVLTQGLPPSHLIPALYVINRAVAHLAPIQSQHLGSPVMWRLVNGTVGCWYRFVWAPNTKVEFIKMGNK